MEKMVSMYTLICLRCGHTWESRDEHPVRCASCKSPYWWKPRRDEEKSQ